MTSDLLRDDDVIAMIGDSITYAGSWWAALREALLARRPQARCVFHNCGVPGDSAQGALGRYAWDIAPLRPTLAFVMFGMNDVGRDDYGPERTAPEDLARRNGALERFAVALEALTSRLLADGVRVILVSPTPFDQYAERATPNLPGCDDALATCAGIARGLAAARGLPVIDLHTPLRRRCRAGEAIIGEDRVHPNEAGLDAMAEVVIGQLLPGPPVAVPPALRQASRALQEVECSQRTIAMFRCWAQGQAGRTDDETVLAVIERGYANERNPWVLGQMELCRKLLPRQAQLAAEVVELRRQVAAAAGSR